jgi:ABC-type antimicrobial peptide transport system permease subunit
VVRGRREIGVRMALGAESPRVVRDQLRRAGGLVALGCLLGGVGAVAAARAVAARLLFEVSPGDPAALGAAALLLMLVGVIATVVPARRAAAVDPMHVLRGE